MGQNPTKPVITRTSPKINNHTLSEFRKNAVVRRKIEPKKIRIILLVDEILQAIRLSVFGQLAHPQSTDQIQTICLNQPLET